LQAVTRPIVSAARLSALAPFCAAIVLVGCGDDIDARPDVETAEADALRLGRVHVVLEPADAAAVEEDEELEVTARFAFVRGLDEDFARARIDMPFLAHEVLPRNQCTAEDLTRSAEPEVDPPLDRELMLVDAGNLRIHTGDATLQVPLELVPDLLPYMSGVQYVYREPMAASDTDGVSSLVVEADGSPSEELPAFSVESTLPLPPTLTFLEEDLDDLARDALVLRWNEASDPELPLTLEFTPTLGGEVIGDTITCVFDDVGQTRVDMQVLYTLGLPHRADSLQVTASRAVAGSFDAGEFADSELIVERRSTTTVPLP
jgi:hypothetical protein